MKKKLIQISLVVVVALALIVELTQPAAGWNSDKAANPAGTTQAAVCKDCRAGWNN